MNSNDQVLEKSKLVTSALEYAHDNSLNISNRDDVKKILDALDAGDENVEEFMNLLQNAEAFTDMTTREVDKKSNLPN